MICSNSVYCFIVFYIIGLCAFIAAWVFSFLGFQLFWEIGLSAGWHESQTIELAWTFLPTFVISGLCFSNLGCMTDFNAYSNVGGLIKAVGHQWYWEFNVPACGFSFMSSIQDLVCSVDNPLILEAHKMYQLFVTSADVIHSFSIPELNLKIDAIPGRVNLRSFLLDRSGVFVGYCTELCGAGHAFMPIVLESLNKSFR